MTKPLDVITIGRSSVDLYGVQIGGRLEDMASFRKYIGGSPTNIAAGTARLGLKSALITRVGDEHMGRFIREELAKEGVDVRGVKTDPERLTALVLLGIRDEKQFPLIFYRADCADMALCEDDIEEVFISEARSVVATGTHLSNLRTEAAVLKALRIARRHGARTALDIDYRPNLWGLAGHGAGESRYIESSAVTKKLQGHLNMFDLVVGTEEEFHIAGGSTDTIAALRAVRSVSGAVLVCKRGAEGAVVFTGAIPDRLDAGEKGPGFPIEVFNVLGAGDGFMSGLIKGWLEDAPWPSRARIRQRLRRLRGQPPRLHAGLPLLRRTCVLPQTGHHAEGPSQGRRARTTPLVDQSARRLVACPDLRVRSPHATGGDGRGNAREDRGFQAALSRRRPEGCWRPLRLRDPVRLASRPGRALCGERNRLVDRAPGGMARVSAARSGA